MESLGKALHARQGFGLYASISGEPAKVFGPRDRVGAERGCEKYLLGVPQPPLSTLVSGSAAPKRPVPAVSPVSPARDSVTSCRPHYLPFRLQQSPAFAQLIGSLLPSPYLDRGFLNQQKILTAVNKGSRAHRPRFKP